jgi:hypothetical protein
MRTDIANQFFDAIRDSVTITQSHLFHAMERTQDLNINPMIPLVIMRYLIQRNLDEMHAADEGKIPNRIKEALAAVAASSGEEKLKNAKDEHELFERLIEYAVDVACDWQKSGRGSQRY